ncbi:glycosyltransferase family 4 protein [Mycolicibacterium sp. BiH015]|uniref:glycosyltransferase family 4 protein n=1 Tax=Mycolicibacterium sp. BiH015 TaxID=3018808 RepID=UPI0022E97389|nr:glycosyltransferase family 4 protein [Mycolicibacterium sp. BiH015]MDA2895466.1 glycosyltransferase family 4 protein [Mycolicibacterium sp. BiH015]
MRVAIIDPLGQYAGNHHYTDDMARGLARAGVDVTVYAHSGDVVRESDRPYGYVESFSEIYGDRSRAVRGLQFLRCLVQTFAYISRQDVDIVHIQLWAHDVREIAQVGFARLLRKRVVITAHEARGWRSGGQLEGASTSANEAQAARGSQWIMNRADGIIVHNKYSYRQLTSSYYPHGPVVIVPYINHVESLGFLPGRSDARQRLNLPQDKKIFLFFGNCRPEKGLDLALKAMAELKHFEDQVLLVTAGKMKPDEEDFFRSLVSSLGLGSLVRMDVGLVPDEEAIAYYRAADVVVLPYRHIYDSGVAMTASTCARAVLTSDLPPMLELTENGRLGLHFETHSVSDLAYQMKRVIEMGEELDALGAKARDKVLSERDPDLIAAKILALYQEVLGAAD